MSPAKRLSGYLPGHENVPLLQIASYDLRGRRIVAVFNFWDKAPAFFDLKLEGLKGAYAVMDETGTEWMKTEAERNWSAAELKKGIRLAVGAARCRVFEIVPAGEATEPAAQMTAPSLEEVFRGLRPSLDRAVREDLEYEKTYKDYGINPMPVI